MQRALKLASLIDSFTGKLGIGVSWLALLMILIGAYNAVAALCRHPDVFSHAICMSGTYDLQKFLQGPKTKDYYESSPLDFVPDLPEDGDHLAALRQRFVLLTHGDGRWEEPSQSSARAPWA